MKKEYLCRAECPNFGAVKFKDNEGFGHCHIPLLPAIVKGTTVGETCHLSFLLAPIEMFMNEAKGN